MGYYAYTVKHTTKDVKKALENNCQCVYLSNTETRTGSRMGDYRVRDARTVKGQFQVKTDTTWLNVLPGDVLESR